MGRAAACDQRYPNKTGIIGFVDWTKVVTDPLGLAGFALALVFGVVARRRGAGWIVAVMLAGVCIAGGLTIAYRRVGPAFGENPQPAASQPPAQPAFVINQSGGCNIAGVTGNGNVTTCPEKDAKSKE